MLAPGGRLLIAEFHRPDPWVLRALSWTYFKVFEPLGPDTEGLVLVRGPNVMRGYLGRAELTEYTACRGILPWLIHTGDEDAA